MKKAPPEKEGLKIHFNSKVTPQQHSQRFRPSLLGAWQSASVFEHDDTVTAWMDIRFHCTSCFGAANVLPFSISASGSLPNYGRNGRKVGDV